MGITHTTVSVAPVGRKTKPWKSLFLVDSGASTSMAPGKVLRRLGVKPFRKDKYELADGTMTEFAIGVAMITVKGVTVGSEVIFGPDDSEPLLGAQTMQAANLIWDAQREELIPSPRLKPLKLAVASLRRRRHR